MRRSTRFQGLGDTLQAGAHPVPVLPPTVHPPSQCVTFSKYSSGPISGGMIVVHDGPRVCPASPMILAHMTRVAGLATSATSAADQHVTVLRCGEYEEPSWDWLADAPVYLGAGGVMTQAWSAAWSFCLIVGHALTSSRVMIDFRTPVVQQQG